MRARLQGLTPRGDFKNPYDIRARAVRNPARGPSNNEQIKADTSVLDGILAAERSDKYAAKADKRRAEIKMALAEYDNNLRKDLEKFRFENLGGEEELEIRRAQLKSNLAQFALYASDRVRDLMSDKSKTNRLVRAREEGENLEQQAEEYLTELNQLVDAEVLNKIMTSMDKEIRDYIERMLPSAQDQLSQSQQEELIRMFGSKYKPLIEKNYEDQKNKVMEMQMKAAELKTEGLTRQAANQLILELDKQLKPLRRMASNFFDEAQDDNLNRQAPKSSPPPPPTTAPNTSPPPFTGNDPLGSSTALGGTGSPDQKKPKGPLEGIVTQEEPEGQPKGDGQAAPLVPARPTTKRRGRQGALGLTMGAEAEAPNIPTTKRRGRQGNLKRTMGAEAPNIFSAIPDVFDLDNYEQAPKVIRAKITEQAPSLPDVDILSRVASREDGPMFSVYDQPPPTRMMPVSQYGNAERQAMSRFQGQNVIPVNAVQTLPDGTTAGFRALAIDSNGDGNPDKILDIIDQPRFTNPKGQRIDQQFNSPEMLNALRGSLGI